ncbi:MAG TPA: glycosyltransferase family A protein [Candidatus Elarobacter sp.]|jgi:glycosyltransferase involved in cell wall biosynthesis|nr:glycosyltransferase family A protein [Candidatus Elarobacter sp.]
MIELSVVVAAHDMRREIPRTVRSLSPPYQRGIDRERLEIIVVDNGSHEPVDTAWFAGVAAEVRVMRFPPGDPSPCHAINAGVATARGAVVAVLIDGARIASPGLFERAFAAMRIADDVFVATMGFHLGHETQQVSLAKGYSRDVEDRLLAEVGWPRDGYRLFEICARGESYHDGVLSPFSETVACVMWRESFARVGGFHEGFRYGGGGLANLEFFERVHADAAITPVVLVGEGTFHQVHYGSTTRAGGVRARETPDGPTIWDAMSSEFERLVGRPPLSLALRKPLLFGRCESAAAERCFFGDPHGAA